MRSFATLLAIFAAFGLASTSRAITVVPLQVRPITVELISGGTSVTGVDSVAAFGATISIGADSITFSGFHGIDVSMRGILEVDLPMPGDVLIPVIVEPEGVVGRGLFGPLSSTRESLGLGFSLGRQVYTPFSDGLLLSALAGDTERWTFTLLASSFDQGAVGGTVRFSTLPEPVTGWLIASALAIAARLGRPSRATISGDERILRHSSPIPSSGPSTGWETGPTRRSGTSHR